MADITNCGAKNCKIRDYCYRYTAKDGYWQSYANLNDDKEINDKKECSYFYKNKRCVERESLVGFAKMIKEIGDEIHGKEQ